MHRRTPPRFDPGSSLVFLLLFALLFYAGWLLLPLSGLPLELVRQNPLVNALGRPTQVSQGTSNTTVGGATSVPGRSATASPSADGSPGANPAASGLPTSSPEAPTAVPTGTIPLTITAAATTIPAAILPSPVPELTPALAIRHVEVANTGGNGVYLRRLPASQDLLQAWPDNTRLELLGAPQQVGNETWYWVRDPDGSEGYVPGAYAVPVAP